MDDLFNTYIIISIGLGIFFLLICFFLFKSYRKQKSTIKELSEHLDADQIKSGSHYQATLDGQTYEYSYYAGSKNNPSYFKIFIPCNSSGEFTIGKENWFDKFFKKLGIAVEMQTGDTYFDSKVYIKSNTIGFTRSYFADSSKREAIIKLLDQGFTNLKYNGSIFELTKSPFQLKKDIQPQFVTDAVREIIKLTKDLPDAIPQGLIMGVADWKFKRTAIITISGILAASGIGSIFWVKYKCLPLDGWDVFLYSTKYWLIAYITILFLSAQGIRGRSSSHYELLTCFISLTIGMPTLGYGVTSSINAYQDAAPVTKHRKMVISKRYSKSDDSTNYYINVKSWRPGKSREEFEVASKMYYRVQPNSTYMDIETKPGKLGFEWLVSLNQAH